MINYQEMFMDDFHSSDLIDVTAAKGYESRYGINLHTNKATDPELEWKCSVGTCEDDNMLWFWVTTTDHAVWVNTNDDTLLPVGESMVWPRRLTADQITTVAPKFSVQSELLGDSTLELVNANPTFAHWICLSESGESLFSFTMSKEDTFYSPEFDLQIYGASDNELVFPTIRYTLLEAIQKNLAEPMVGFIPFAFNQQHMLYVENEDGDFWIYTTSHIVGLHEVDGDVFDKVYPIAEFLTTRQKIQYPVAQ